MLAILPNGFRCCHHVPKIVKTIGVPFQSSLGLRNSHHSIIHNQGWLKIVIGESHISNDLKFLVYTTPQLHNLQS